MNMKPSSAETYERARRHANTLLWAIDLQCRRIRSSEPEDKDFFFRKFIDFDFLIVSLVRFRRTIKLASNIPEIKSTIIPALHEFDAAMPQIKKLRDVAEHIDEYAIDKGWDSSIERNQLEVSSLAEGENDAILSWLGHEINISNALKASTKLYGVLKNASIVIAQRA
jgi:hypothetical protein